MADVVDRRTVQLEIVMKGLDEANRRLRELEKSSRDTADALQSMQGKFESITSGATKALAGLAVGFLGIKSIDAFAGNIESATKMAGELYKLSIQTGTSVEELSKLGSVAKLSGTSMSTVGTALQSLSKAMYETAGGTGKARDTFYAMGLSVKDAAGQLKPAADFMQEVAKKLEGMGNETQKVAAAQKILKGVGAEVLPFLHDLALAGQLDAKVTSQQAFQAHQYEIALTALQSVKKGLYNTISQQVTPVMTALTRTFTDLLTQTGGLSDTVKKLAAENAIRQWAVNGALAITFVVDKLSDTAKVIVFVGEVVATLGSVAWSVFKVIGSAIVTASQVLDEFGQMALGVSLIMAGQFQLGAQLVSTAWGRMKEGVGSAFDGMKRELAGAVQETSELFGKFDELQKSLGQDTYTNAFLEQYGKVIATLDKAKKGHETVAVAAKYQKDAIDGLEQSYAVAIAQMNANVEHLRLYGVELKATAAAELEARFLEDSFKAVLVEHAKARNTTVEAIKAHLRELARLKDGTELTLESERKYVAFQKGIEEASYRAAKAVDDQVTALEKSIATYGMTTAAVTRYEIALLEEEKRIAENVDGDWERSKSLQAVIDRLNKLAGMQDQFDGMKNFNSAVAEGAKWVGEIARGFAESVSKGIDVARQKLKQFVYDLIEIFAKKWFLNIVAGATGSTSIGAMAGQVGQGTVAGAAGNLLSSAFTAGATSLFGEAGATFAAAATSGFSAGVSTLGIAMEAGASAVGGFSAVLGAAIPVIGWVVAIGAVLYSLFGHKGGGPKTEGSFVGQFGASGDLTTQLSGSAVQISGSGADSAAAQMGQQMAASFFQTVHALGGSVPNGATFGLGFSQDTAGTANSMVHGLAQVGGQTVFQQNLDDVARGDEALQGAISQQLARMELAALQHIDFDGAVNAVLRSVDVSSATLEQVQAVILKAQDVATALTGIKALTQYGLTGLNVDSLKELQRQGETLTQTMQRVAQETAAMDDAFTTQAEKLTRGRTALESFYSELSGAGLSIPKSREQWLSLYKSLDLNTEAGRHFRDEMNALGGTFLSITDQMKQDWESVQASIDKLTGRNRGPGQLADLTSQFEAGHSQFSGLTADQLVQVLTTITAEDFAKYSAADQALIKAILELAVTMTGAASTISSAAQNVNYTTLPPSYWQTTEGFTTMFMKQFTDQTSGVLGASPNLQDKLTLQIQLMQDQLSKWQAIASSLDASGQGYSPEYNALINLIQSFQSQIGTAGGPAVWNPNINLPATGLIADLSKLTILTAQYGQEKAEQLFDLDKWHDQQKALIGDNNVALLALEKEYADKRTAILEDASVAGVDAIAQIRDSIGKWRDSLLTGDLSPLTGAQRFQQALAQYQTTVSLARGGDEDALRSYQQMGQLLLSLGVQNWGRSSVQFADLFKGVLSDALDLATATTTPATLADVQLSVQDQTNQLSSDLGDVKLLLQQMIAAIDANTQETSAQTQELTTDYSTRL